MVSFYLECTKKYSRIINMSYDSACLRRVGNWSFITKNHKFDKPSFKPDVVLDDLDKYSPKVVYLLKKIKELDDHDMLTDKKHYKHFIFSEVKQGGYGVKVLTAALLANGFNLGYDRKIKVLPDNELLKTKGKNILLLSSTPVFDNAVNVKAKKAILSKYNQRPENINGDLARIILLDSGFKEGIDLFDVKYVHIFEPQTSKADQQQAIGRATRLCGQKGLNFHPKFGWPLEVFIYDVQIPNILGDRYGTPSLFKMFLNYSGIDQRQLSFVEELEKYAMIGAVDYELNRNVHRFALEEEDVDIKWMFDGGVAKKRPEEVACNKKCSKSRPTKDVPVSMPLFIAIVLVLDKDIPDLRKNPSPRTYFCELLKNDPEFCAAANEAWKDPVKYLQNHKEEILDAIKRRKHNNFPARSRQPFLNFAFKIIEKPKVIKPPKTVKETVKEIKPLSPEKTVNTVKTVKTVQGETPKSITPSITPSKTPKDETPKSITPSKTVTTVQGETPKSTTPSKTPQPQSPQKTPKTPSVEENIPLTTKKETEQLGTPEPPKKLLGFMDMRKYIRDNFIQYSWPKVRLENMCIPKGGSEIVKFTPTQDFVSNYFTPALPYKGMLLFHSVGTGKCHAKNTPIIMFDGSIKMVQDIKIGDKLMGDDSTPRKVLSLANGIDDMYDIIPVKGDKYTVNSEHILCLKCSGRGCITISKSQPNKPFKTTHLDNKTIKYVSKSFNTRVDAELHLSKFTEKDKIIEIEVKDYLKLPKSTQKELKGYRKGIELQTKEVDFDPYIIGLWMGDGTSREPKITTQDSKILVYLRKELTKYGLLLTYESKYDYRINSDTPGKRNKFLEILQKYNLINNKHIPDIYKYNDRNIRLKVLAGFLDTDGSYSKKDKCFEITQKSNQLAKDILYIARSLGFAAYSQKRSKSWTYKGIKKTGIYNTILISGNGLENIPTILFRKQALIRNQKKDALVTGISVKSVGRGEYFGFTLDGNNRYLLGDFTVTHNTCSAIATATQSFEPEGYTILWVTRTTLKSDVFKNMFDQVCNVVFQEKMKTGFDMPSKNEERMRLLSKAWKIRPMSYKQFSNLVGGKNRLYQDLVAINGKEDPLRKTLLIIDEAHKLYGGADLSSVERPDMNRLHKSIMQSYVTSGKDSVRLLLMTATPITNDPMELIKLLNLCRLPNDQLQTEYDKFANNYIIDESGKFSNKGSLKFLDAISGYISYLSREKDARQFSQPVITFIEAPLSRSAFDKEKVDKIETEFKDKLQTAKDEIIDTNNEFNVFKKQVAENKKLAKKKCVGLKKQEKTDCLSNLQIEMDQLNDSLFEKKADTDKQKYKIKENVKQIRKEMRALLKDVTEDRSQEGIIENKCFKKPKKTKGKKSSSNGNRNSNSNSIEPSSSKSNSEPIKY